MALPEHTLKETSLERSATRIHYAYVVIAIGILSLVGSLGLGRFAYALLLPAMLRDFHTTYTQMGSIATANAVAYMISAVICGLLTSRFGQRVVISSALLLCALGLAWTALAQGIQQAIMAQFVCGLGTGGAVGPVYTLAAPWFAASKRGRASGILQTGNGAGILLGGFLVPQLLLFGGHGGWRFAWAVLAGLVCSIGLAAAVLLRNTPAEKRVLPVGYQQSVRDPAILGSSVSAGQTITLRSMYGSPLIWHLGAIFACFGLSYVVYTVFFAAYLLSNGLSSGETGLIWALAGATSTAGSLLWGWLADRLGRRPTLIIVLSLQGSAFLDLGLSHTRPGLYLGALTYGLALWGMPLVMTLATADIAGPSLAAPALGMVILFFSIGQATGPLLAGWLKDSSGSLVLPLLVAAGIIWIGALLALALKLPVHST